MEPDLYSTSSSAMISAAPISCTSCPSTSGSAPHLTTRLLPRSRRASRSAPRLPSNPANPCVSAYRTYGDTKCFTTYQTAGSLHTA